MVRTRASDAVVVIECTDDGWHDRARAARRHAGNIESLRAMSTRHVESVLAHTNGDKSRAAAILGVDVSTLYRWRRQRPDG